MIGLYPYIKFANVLLAIVAVGFNAPYGVWLARAARRAGRVSDGGGSPGANGRDKWLPRATAGEIPRGGRPCPCPIPRSAGYSPWAPSPSPPPPPPRAPPARRSRRPPARSYR